MISCWLLLDFSSGKAKPIRASNNNCKNVVAIPTLSISRCDAFRKRFYHYYPNYSGDAPETAILLIDHGGSV